MGGSAFALVLDLFRIFSVPPVALTAALRARGRGLGLVLRAALTQVTHTATRPFLPMALLAVLLGVLVAYATNRIIGSTLWSGRVPAVMAVAVAREIAPLVVSLVLVARTGTQVTFQLGLMRAGHELDAMESVGIDPNYFVVFPRLLGITAATMGLTILVGTVGLVGGHAVARALDALSYTVSASDVLLSVTTFDIAMALSKAFLSGLFVAATSCHFALHAERSPVGVREAADSSTMWGSALCIAVNAGISVYGFSG